MTTAPARLAKLTRPLPAAALPRERLFDLLHQRLGRAPVVWISGPPGSGKTTLVADYIARRQLQCVWYQLDRGDDDIASFFHYLTESVQPWLGGASLPRFEPEFLVDLEAYARNYFRELFRHLDRPVLVFDNHHEVHANGPLNGALQQALAELPGDGGLVVLSRNDPPATFAVLRARGKLETLGWSELRLTPEECAGVARLRRAALDEQALDALYARTQGWVAGLVLMLQEWHRDGDPPAHAGGGVPTVIFDYLAEEIFKKLGEREQEALLRLAYLPQITATMARELGVDEAARLALAELARSEFLATVMLVEPEPISQLHPLLREFLLARARQTGSKEQVSGRMHRAAQVLATAGHVEAAAALWIKLQDGQSLCALIRGSAAELLRQGRHRLLMAWIQALPGDAYGDDPELLFWQASARHPGAPREARELFSRSFRLFTARPDSAPAWQLAALNGVLEAILHDSADDYSLLDPWIDTALGLLGGLADGSAPELEGRAVCNLFMSLALRRPNHPEIHDWRARAQRCCQAQVDPNARILMESTLAVLASWNGQFPAAERALGALRTLLARPDVSQVSATHFAQAEATHFMLCGDRDRCLEAVRRGLDGAQRSGIRLWNDTFLANAFCGVLADGDLEAAAGWLAELDGRAGGSRRYDDFLRAYGSAWFASLRGDSFLAHQHIKVASATAEAVGLHGFRILADLALVHVLMDAADPRGAERELARAARLVAELGNRMFEFMAQLCRARLASLRGDEAALSEALACGLQIARDRGLTYHMGWNPRVMAQLMQQALERGIEADFVRGLIVQRRLFPDAPPYHLASWPWQFRVRVLGKFRFEAARGVDGALARRSVMPMALLKALVAAGGEEVRLQRLADQLWPHKEGDYANRSLTMTLHRLRKLLGDDSALLVQGGSLSLNRRLVWCDTWAFDVACHDAAVLANGRAAAPALAAAGHGLLELYRGPLLDGDPKAPWAEGPRLQRRNQFQRVLGMLGQALERLGETEQAIALYRHAIEVEPAGETLADRLAKSLGAAGREAEAAEVQRAKRSRHDT